MRTHGWSRFACASAGEAWVSWARCCGCHWTMRVMPAGQRAIAHCEVPEPCPRESGDWTRDGALRRRDRFLRQAGRSGGPAHPALYHTALNRETGDFTLLLEDLAPAMPGDQVAGSTPEQAAAAVGAIARFQAAWWDRVDTPALAWMRRFDLASFGHIVKGRIWPPGSHASPILATTGHPRRSRLVNGSVP